MTTSQVNDLTLPVTHLKKNADTVEKNLLRAEDLLVNDADNDKRNVPFKHQKENPDLLSEAEGILEDLFPNLDKAMDMLHPQTGEIEKDSLLNDLALLIADVKKNAYTVEKDVLRAKDLLVIDAHNDKRNLPFKHQKENSDLLSEAKGILKDLFLDLDKTMDMLHLQTGEVEKDSLLNDLILLITDLKKNADTVEKDVLRAKDLLVIDADNDKRNLPFKHQKENSDLLSEAEMLLKDLLLDLDKAMEMIHQQPGKIAKESLLNELTLLIEDVKKKMDVEDDCYPTTKRPLGHCLIINNYIFEEGSKLKHRKGTDADKVVERRDLVNSDMMKAVKEFAEMDHSKMDVFVCCILSHGEKGTVIGSDGNPVRIRDLTQHFAQCPMLTGKPKIFFIQACHDKELQRGVWEQDGFEEGEEYEDDGKKNVSCIPKEADFLIGMATVESYKSFRHTVDGSIFIQELCRQLTNGCRKQEDILSILTKVNRMVAAQDPNGKKQMPEPRYTLTRKLVLPMD